MKQRLAKTLVAIKSAIRSIGTSNAETNADIIKQQDTIEQWYKGLSDAIDNANKAGKTTATTEAETATVAETTTEAPQAPPVETNPDLFMGEESARREQLRSCLLYTSIMGQFLTQHLCGDRREKMTIFLLEYQANNDGSCTATAPLGYTDEIAALSAFYSKCASAVVSSCDTHTVMLVDSEGEVWRGYKQILRHGHEVVES